MKSCCFSKHFVTCCINWRLNFHQPSTRDYEKKIKELNLTPFEAAVKVIEWRKNNSSKSDIILYPGENHYIIIDDSLVFSRFKKKGVALSGFYVNGKTGKVSKIENDQVLSIFDQKKRWGKSATKKDCYIYKPKK